MKALTLAFITILCLVESQIITSNMNIKFIQNFLGTYLDIFPIEVRNRIKIISCSEFGNVNHGASKSSLFPARQSFIIFKELVSKSYTSLQLSQNRDYKSTNDNSTTITIILPCGLFKPMKICEFILEISNCPVATVSTASC